MSIEEKMKGALTRYKSCKISCIQHQQSSWKNEKKKTNWEKKEDLEAIQLSSLN
jgi:hypothetical protein